jgi:hypothetical protein
MRISQLDRNPISEAERQHLSTHVLPTFTESAGQVRLAGL